MSEAAVTSVPPHHPIGLIVTDDLKRSRLTVFFRLILAIPVFIWLYIWGIAAGVAVLIAWIVAIFTGRVPEGLHGFLASYLRYWTRTRAYTLLLSNPFPGFTNAAAYPVDARVDAGEKQSRLTVFFRLLLGIPAFLLVYVFQSVNSIIAFISWFYILFTGHMNDGMENLSNWLLRYEVQTYGYVMLLTGRYPSLAGAPTA
jgi:hypothetical protein